MKVYFTFELYQNSGIGDQLGAQLAHLYALGSACGWQYVHLYSTQFKRHVNPLLDRLGKRIKSKGLIEGYLGLSNTDDFPQVDGVHNVSISTLLDNANSISDVNNNLYDSIITSSEKFILSSESPEVLIIIDLGTFFHQHINKIHKVLNSSWSQILLQAAPYLKARSKALANNRARSLSTPYTVLHIRLGDSICIDTHYGQLVLHGNKLYRSLSEYSIAVNSTDPNRKPACNPIEISLLARDLIKNADMRKHPVYLISDGFASSVNLILYHMSNKILSPHHAFCALLSLGSLRRKYQSSFEWIPKERRLIGESVANTIRSIELISNASLVLCNSGGFSHTIHNLYNSNCEANSFLWIQV